jgi:nucleoside-diphosphate-sugar epimerase
MGKRTAVITGVSSFVGCHLARAFAANGWDVIAVTSRERHEYEGIRAERLGFIPENATFAVCDLTDPDALAALVQRHAPALWVQHAGYADNYASLDYDLEKSLDMNVVALAPLYRALAGTGCGVVVTGSSMEYATSDLANREEDACWPDMPYGVSKLTEAVEAHRLSQQYGVPTRIARLYIPVGPLDAPGKLMDFVIKKLVNGEVAELSPCTQKRDFLGVSEVCAAYLKLAEDLPRRGFDVFNICSGEARELKSLLIEVAELAGASPDLLDFGARPMRAGEAMVSYGDNAKARDLLDWHPAPIEASLKLLIEYVRASN